MSKSLKVIQTIMKIARILSTVAFVLCIVGGAGCLLGLLATVVAGDTLSMFTEATGSISTTQVYFACFSGLIVCVSECILSKFAMVYFKHELDMGTPFTYAGAKEFLRLGILMMAIPVGASIVVGFTAGIMELISGETLDMGDEFSVSLTTGTLFVAMSFVFKHGAELAERLLAQSESKSFEEATETFEETNTKV